MRRRYNLAMFGELIEKLNSELPTVGIGVDVIVGFPGETDESFENTYKFLDSQKVSYLHVFSYSERKNTLAITMDGKVDIKTRRQRSEKLRNLSSRKKYDFYSRYIGKEQKVLFENKVIKHDGVEYVEGWTDNYIRVRIKNDIRYHNSITNVTLSNLNGIKSVESFYK